MHLLKLNCFHHIENPRLASVAWMFQRKPSSGNFSDSVSSAKRMMHELTTKSPRKGIDRKVSTYSYINIKIPVLQGSS